MLQIDVSQVASGCVEAVAVFVAVALAAIVAVAVDVTVAVAAVATAAMAVGRLLRKSRSAHPPGCVASGREFH